MFAPLEGWRHVKVTDRHTGVDFVHALKDLSDIHFLNAKKIVLVQDNLTPTPRRRFMKLFPPPKQGDRPNGSNGTIRQSTVGGPIWRSPNWVSFRPRASIAASRTNKPSSLRPRLGRMIEIRTTPRPFNSSPQRTHGSNSSIFTRQSDGIEPLVAIPRVRSKRARYLFRRPPCRALIRSAGNPHRIARRDSFLRAIDKPVRKGHSG